MMLYLIVYLVAYSIVKERLLCSVWLSPVFIFDFSSNLDILPFFLTIMIFIIFSQMVS